MEWLSKEQKVSRLAGSIAQFEMMSYAYSRLLDPGQAAYMKLEPIVLGSLHKLCLSRKCSANGLTNMISAQRAFARK